jgi:hypothetical protein
VVKIKHHGQVASLAKGGGRHQRQVSECDVAGVVGH